MIDKPRFLLEILAKLVWVFVSLYYFFILWTFPSVEQSLSISWVSKQRWQISEIYTEHAELWSFFDCQGREWELNSLVWCPLSLVCVFISRVLPNTLWRNQNISSSCASFIWNVAFCLTAKSHIHTYIYRYIWHHQFFKERTASKQAVTRTLEGCRGRAVYASDSSFSCLVIRVWVQILVMILVCLSKRLYCICF